MHMNAFEILVVILSITLAVFLILAIIGMALFIRFMKGMQDVPEKLGGVLDDVGKVSGAVRDVASPLVALGSLIKQYFPSSGKKR